MKGGVSLFHGKGADARHYVESDRARADDYYLSADDAIARYTVTGQDGETVSARSLSGGEYEGWVDWINPDTNEKMGTPRRPGGGRDGSPLFAEMIINTPKSLSVAAALHPDVSKALDHAQEDAASEIRRFLGQHSVTLAGPRGAQEVVAAEHMQTVGITHRTSRAGDPHRHIHFQIGTRIWAAGKWRALTTSALFKQQGAIRALGTAIINAHPELADTLAAHGLTLDPVSGEVAELEAFNPVMSKRAAQVEANLDRMEAEWRAEHPGEEIGPALSARMQTMAWNYQRPSKKPASLKAEQWWIRELEDAGYDPDTLKRRAMQLPVAVDDLSVQEVANRALDRCAAGASAWTVHTIREHATRIVTEYGVRVTPAQLREVIEQATTLAAGDCFSILPPDAPTAEHVAHLTSVDVVAAETALRDQLTASVPNTEPKHPDVTTAAENAGLGDGQKVAAAAVASADPLVIVEGAAGSGKTTMLRTAIAVAAEHGRASRVVAPTLRAAQVAHDELGVPATSVAALVHAHGWRWNADGVWTRLQPGDTDPETGRIYTGPPDAARLARGERVICDEAGMLDQDTARALLTITQEAGATVALVGDRAQLPAVGRGGVLDMAAQIRGRTYNMTELHRFADPDYAQLTLRIRDGQNPGDVFDRLADAGLVQLHDGEKAMREQIATEADRGEAITTATNEAATALNERIRAQRIEAGEVDDKRTVTGSDGLSIGAGNVIQTRLNNPRLGVANRQTWIVQHVSGDGMVYAAENTPERRKRHLVALPAEYVGEHAHLSYATTAYGVQGATVQASHTILTEATSAAGIYVGMTRGRETNRLHVVAEDLDDARQQFIDAMQRDRADRGLAAAVETAREQTQGLISEGPIRLVTEEIARLDHEAEQAEKRAKRWEQIVASLDTQRATHRAEDDEDTEAVTKAEETAERVRAEIAQPLTVQAETNGADYLTAVADEDAAHEKAATVGRFGRRKARAEHRTATEHTQSIRTRVRETWGEPPATGEALSTWAQQQGAKRAEADPRVIDAARAVEQAQADRASTGERHDKERLALLVSAYGVEHVRGSQLGMRRTTNPHRDARNARKRAAAIRTEADTLRGLPVEDAARRIEARNAEQKQQRQQAARDPFEHDPYRRDPRREGRERGL